MGYGRGPEAIESGLSRDKHGDTEHKHEEEIRFKLAREVLGS
jgi:hypothetical protein